MKPPDDEPPRLRKVTIFSKSHHGAAFCRGFLEHAASGNDSMSTRSSSAFTTPNPSPALGPQRPVGGYTLGGLNLSNLLNTYSFTSSAVSHAQGDTVEDATGHGRHAANQLCTGTVRRNNVRFDVCLMDASVHLGDDYEVHPDRGVRAVGIHAGGGYIGPLSSLAVFDPCHIVGTDGIIFLFSMADRDSFTYVQRIRDVLLTHMSPVPCILVGAVADDPDVIPPQRCSDVRREEVELKARAWQCPAVVGPLLTENTERHVVERLIQGIETIRFGDFAAATAAKASPRLAPGDALPPPMSAAGELVSNNSFVRRSSVDDVAVLAADSDSGGSPIRPRGTSVMGVRAALTPPTSSNNVVLTNVGTKPAASQGSPASAAASAGSTPKIGARPRDAKENVAAAKPGVGRRPRAKTETQSAQPRGKKDCVVM